MVKSNTYMQNYLNCILYHYILMYTNKKQFAALKGMFGKPFF